MKTVNNVKELREAEKYYGCGPREAIICTLLDFFSLEFEKGTFERQLRSLTEDELVDTFNAYFIC